MTYITSASRWIRQANLSIEVGSIQIYLSAILVDDLASFLNAILEDTIRGWISNLMEILSKLTAAKHRNLLTMKAARLSLYWEAFAWRSPRSKLPSGRTFTETTFKPAMTADWNAVNRLEINFNHRFCNYSQQDLSREH